MDYKKLGTAVRQARISAGLTQEKVAETLSLSDSYIGQIERGERSVTLDTLEKLCAVLKINMGLLLLDLDELSGKDNTLQKLAVILSDKTQAQKEKLFSIISSIVDYGETD
jgi:transcriptional regulator with XRE-family HTH domain